MPASISMNIMPLPSTAGNLLFSTDDHVHGSLDLTATAQGQMLGSCPQAQPPASRDGPHVADPHACTTTVLCAVMHTFHNLLEGAALVCVFSFIVSAWLVVPAQSQYLMIIPPGKPGVGPEGPRAGLQHAQSRFAARLCSHA